MATELLKGLGNASLPLVCQTPEVVYKDTVATTDPGNNNHTETYTPLSILNISFCISISISCRNSFSTDMIFVKKITRPAFL